MTKIPYEKLEEMVTVAHQRSVGSRWKHYKGDIYVVADIALIESTMEIAVIYSSLEHPRVRFIRPLSVWGELVEWNGRTVPRFSKIETPV